MSTSLMALVRVGYQEYAVPVDALSGLLATLGAMRKVDSRYEKGGYVYWYGDDAALDMGVTVVCAARILDCDPGKAVAAPPAPAVVQAPDARVIAAPSETPISIRSVPPMRDFVNEYRHEEQVDAVAVGDVVTREEREIA